MEEFLRELANLFFSAPQIALNYEGVAGYEQKLANLYYGASLTSLSTDRMAELFKKRMEGFAQYIETGFAAMIKKSKSYEEEKWLTELKAIKLKYYNKFISLITPTPLEDLSNEENKDWVTYDELRRAVQVSGLSRVNDATWRKRNGFTAFRQPCGKGSAVMYSISETKNWFENNGKCAKH